MAPGERAIGVVRWLIRLAAVAVSIGLAFLGVRSCSFFPQSSEDHSVYSALPEPLRSAAVCRPLTDATPIQKCTIEADHALLFGGLAGGRALTFYADRADSTRGADTVQRWRRSGGTVLRDGPREFLAIGASGDVLYRNTTSGLQIETGTFANHRAAKTFLARSGLVN
ncbi:hypothetical protein DFR69_12234 [Nocardia neocaledoniensis]|uniref:Uncharacterized protein n=2 Tax=Nocardia neocaledoniensis TaxID=236511 RepID=A0A317N1M5_9NOCA|nr:hypothetical protein DFR69_12234 [Nocardia neocaledoniensis]